MNEIINESNKFFFSKTEPSLTEKLEKGAFATPPINRSYIPWKEYLYPTSATEDLMTMLSPGSVPLQYQGRVQISYREIYIVQITDNTAHTTKVNHCGCRAIWYVNGRHRALVVRVLNVYGIRTMIIIVSADVQAPSGAGTSAATVMTTKLGTFYFFHFFTSMIFGMFAFALTRHNSTNEITWDLSPFSSLVVLPQCKLVTLCFFYPYPA